MPGESAYRSLDQACFAAIKQNLRPAIPLYELDDNINDAHFAETVANTLLAMLADGRWRGAPTT